MQPYLFPYLGYYQLVHAVDGFVFYDDVQFTKGGWINRNRILLEGRAHRFTVPCRRASHEDRIRDVVHLADGEWTQGFLGLLRHAYFRAPQYEALLELVGEVFR